MGIDENGRDSFSFVDGFVPDEIGFTTPEQLYKFMKIVRKLHDISLRFTNSPHQVLCHNDLSPCNTVFKNDTPVAVIDWDSVSIGERWQDLTYILWQWINIGNHKRNEIDIFGQLIKAIDSYGADTETRSGFADKLLWRMDKVFTEMPKANYQHERTKEWVEFSKKWVIENKEQITEIIG